MTASVRPQSTKTFHALYALANIGAFVAFVPLINLMLPQRAMELSSTNGLDILSWVLLAGGVASSVSNIGAGWVSDLLIDRTGSRIPMIGVGLVATAFSYAALAMADNLGALIGAFILFQFAFNVMFSPLVALASDHVPDSDKGQLFGYLSLAMPLAQCAVMFLAWSQVATMPGRLLLVAILVGSLTLPMCVWGRRAAGPRMDAQLVHGAAGDVLSGPSGRLGRDFGYAWISRFFIQCCGVAVGSYLFIHLSLLGNAERGGASAEDIFGSFMLVSLTGSLFVGLIAGAWSDRVGRRLPFLRFATLLVGAGCLLMALGDHWLLLAFGFAVFTVGLTGFLTIDSAMIAQIVGQRNLRGVRLGVVNLTNTIPAICVPALSLMLDATSASTTSALFLCMAVGTLVALACVARIRSVR
jgi:MFS family permease